MKAFSCRQKADGIEISYTRRVSHEEALKRKKQLEMSLANYNQQLEQVTQMKELAEAELAELNGILEQDSV